MRKNQSSLTAAEIAVARAVESDKLVDERICFDALILEHSGDQVSKLASVDEAFRPETLAKSRLLFAPMKVLSNPIRLIKLIFPRVMKQLPPEGWDITYIEDSADRITINLTRCFYLNTLADLGAPELTTSFCKSDDVMAECFPPSIRFVCQHTLGSGDELCDFQYCQVKQL